MARGNIVNVPVDIVPTITMLPRTMEDSHIIAIKFKRRKQYKKNEFKENIRPKAVWIAIHYLLENSQLFRDEGIQLDTTWLETIYQTESDNQQFIEECEFDVVIPDEQNQQQSVDQEQDTQEQPANQPLEKSEEQQAQDQDNTDGFEEINEDAEELGNIDRDTLLHDPEIPMELTFAPGEGQIPIGLSYDDNAEYLSFPTIFCGQKRPSNAQREEPVHYSDICKYELRAVDRRVATHIPNLFFKMKKIQAKTITDVVSLSIRRCQTKGKHVTAGDILSEES